MDEGIVADLSHAQEISCEGCKCSSRCETFENGIGIEERLRSWRLDTLNEMSLNLARFFYTQHVEA